MGKSDSAIRFRQPETLIDIKNLNSKVVASIGTGKLNIGDNLQKENAPVGRLELVEGDGFK